MDRVQRWTGKAGGGGREGGTGRPGGSELGAVDVVIVGACGESKSEKREGYEEESLAVLVGVVRAAGREVRVCNTQGRCNIQVSS